jgi:hypothetical protein
MVKMGALKDPRQDNAAGDVLAAFEAAHTVTVYPAWIATAPRSKLGVAPIPIIRPRTRLGRPSVSFWTPRRACG